MTYTYNAIDIGSTPDDGTGDTLYAAGGIINNSLQQMMGRDYSNLVELGQREYLLRTAGNYPTMATTLPPTVMSPSTATGDENILSIITTHTVPALWDSNFVYTENVKNTTTTGTTTITLKRTTSDDIYWGTVRLSGTCYYTIQGNILTYYSTMSAIRLADPGSSDVAGVSGVGTMYIPNPVSHLGFKIGLAISTLSWNSNVITGYARRRGEALSYCIDETALITSDSSSNILTTYGNAFTGSNSSKLEVKLAITTGLDGQYYDSGHNYDNYLYLFLTGTALLYV